MLEVNVNKCHVLSIFKKDYTNFY